VRSNLKRRSSCFGTVQVRLRTHTTLQRVIHCPREIWVVAAVPLEANFKALNPVVLPCSGRCAGATDQRRVGALRLRWLSCARRRLPVNLWPAQPAFLHRRILRLEAHHAPGAFNQRCAYLRITALGHAAWNALAATCAFAGTKPGVGTDGATIIEPMSIADLAREHNAGEFAHAPREARGSRGFQFTC
jgi:hypothetical protein